MELYTNKFNEYLTNKNETLHEFAERSKMSPTTVYKAATGMALRCDTVNKILEHTEGLTKKDFAIIDYSFKEYP
jgi:predicted transcriptional regulator